VTSIFLGVHDFFSAFTMYRAVVEFAWAAR
jgi:hypothetical protein